MPTRTPPQIRIQESKARFKVAAWGRQSGKTTNGGWTMLKRPMDGRRNGTYWHILQTHTAAEVGFNRYVQSFPRDSWSYLWAKKPNESQKEVYLTGGRTVGFKSGQNFEDLRVETLDGVIIDECRQQDPKLWTSVVRPMLGRYKGWADFYSTPNGFDWFYDLTQEYKTDPEWAVYRAPSWEAWWWTPEEIESARRSMTEGEFRQEIGAEFVDLTSGRAYYNFTDENIAPQNPFAPPGQDWSPHLPIAVAMDFNINPMAWTLGQEKINQFYWRREIVLPNSNTFEACQNLIMQVRGHRPGVVIIGDAAGKARQTAAVSQSDYDIIATELRRANIPFQILTPESNPLVKDRVNTTNLALKNSEGKISMWVHSDCESLIRDYKRVSVKESSIGAFALEKAKDKRLTHSSDGVGYYVYSRAKLHFDDRPSNLRVIVR